MDSIKRDELAIFSLGNEGQMTDEEYLSTARELAEKCKIRLEIDETDISYKLYFYLSESIIQGDFVEAWCNLTRFCSMVFYNIKSENKIRVGFFRMK